MEKCESVCAPRPKVTRSQSELRDAAYLRRAAANEPPPPPRLRPGRLTGREATSRWREVAAAVTRRGSQADTFNGAGERFFSGGL